MATAPTFALALVGDRRALAWVLTEGIVAFPRPRSPRLYPSFQAGDSIYIYTTRGCFNNPPRDRSRVIGKAIALTSLRTSEEPVTFGDRSFPLEVRVRIESLAPVGEGVDFAALVPHMNSFPKPEAWSAYLRRSVYLLTQPDARRLDKQLLPFVGKLSENLGGYQQRARIGVVGASE